MEGQKTPNSQSNFVKEKQNQRNQAPQLQTILQSYSNQEYGTGTINRNIEQWNRKESPEINPYTYGQLLYKGSKNRQWRKDNLFNKCCQENWTATCERMKLEHCLIPYIKINSKWIKDHNIRPNNIKLLYENISRTLFDINHSNIFLDALPRVMKINTKLKKKWT